MNVNETNQANTPKTSRRSFLGKTALAGAALSPALHTWSIGAVGANDRIRIAVIGCGGRGYNAHMGEIEKLAKECNVEITAVCDVWRPNLEKAAERVRQNFGNKPKTTTRFMDILENKEIDAVTIATPDHAHSPILAAAARAGKHAYCEKPMADRLDHAQEALHAVEDAGVIVQVGTQRRSWPDHLGACKLIRSGILGTVTEVETSWNDNGPRWNRPFDDVRQEDVDWEQYLIHLPQRPFDPRRYRCWHLYKDYTSGTPGLLGSHFMDIVVWFLQEETPQSCMAHGAKLIWKDREHADTCQCVYEFPKGFMVRYATRLGNSKRFIGEVSFFGSRGTFDTTSWKVTPEGGGKDKIAETIDIQPEPCPGHMQNWLECMRSGKQPVAPIRAGFNHSVAAIMAFRSMELGRRQIYDKKTEEIISV